MESSSSSANEVTVQPSTNEQLGEFTSSFPKFISGFSECSTCHAKEGMIFAPEKFLPTDSIQEDDGSNHLFMGLNTGEKLRYKLLRPPILIGKSSSTSVTVQTQDTDEAQTHCKLDEIIDKYISSNISIEKCFQRTSKPATPTVTPLTSSVNGNGLLNFIDFAKLPLTSAGPFFDITKVNLWKMSLELERARLPLHYFSNSFPFPQNVSKTNLVWNNFEQIIDPKQQQTFLLNGKGLSSVLLKKYLLFSTSATSSSGSSITPPKKRMSRQRFVVKDESSKSRFRFQFVFKKFHSYQ